MNLVNLQQSRLPQLAEVRRAAGVPFAIKGVFRKKILNLYYKVQPDIVVVLIMADVWKPTGIHCGLLAHYGKELAGLCGELWVDGGIRNCRDVLAAGRLGAKTVMIARPVITALLAGGVSGVRSRLAGFFQQNW